MCLDFLIEDVNHYGSGHGYKFFCVLPSGKILNAFAGIVGTYEYEKNIWYHAPTGTKSYTKNGRYELGFHLFPSKEDAISFFDDGDWNADVELWRLFEVMYVDVRAIGYKAGAKTIVAGGMLIKTEVEAELCV